MAQRDLSTRGLGHVLALTAMLVGAGTTAGCAGRSGGRSAADAAGSGARPRVPAYATEDSAWGKFHSRRFQLSVPLPDGRDWKIDDHRTPMLVATHAATDSRLTLLGTFEEPLMNRQRCEARAEALGMGRSKTLTTVEDEVHVGPAAYDSRVLVGIDGRPDGKLEGHVYLFGAFLRRCLLVHLVTSVPSAKDEGVLAARLAIASTRIVEAVALDPPRTTDEATVPRDKPEIQR